MLTEAIGIPAMLEQTAEECIEMAHACLKYARYLREENKVYGKSFPDISYNLHEETADVLICIEELKNSNVLFENDICENEILKKERMKTRLQFEKE